MFENYQILTLMKFFDRKNIFVTTSPPYYPTLVNLIKTFTIRLINTFGTNFKITRWMVTVGEENFLSLQIDQISREYRDILAVWNWRAASVLRCCICRKGHSISMVWFVKLLTVYCKSCDFPIKWLTRCFFSFQPQQKMPFGGPRFDLAPEHDF